MSKIEEIPVREPNGTLGTVIRITPQTRHATIDGRVQYLDGLPTPSYNGEHVNVAADGTMTTVLSEKKLTRV